MTFRQARERQRIVAFLTKVDPSRPERAFSLPPAPPLKVTLSPASTRSRLMAIQGILGRSGGGLLTSVHTSVVTSARVNICEEVGKGDAVFWHSAELYRAICDLELAVNQPRYSAHIEVLSAAIEELRRLSGWQASD